MAFTVLAIVPTPEHGTALEAALRANGAEVTTFFSVGEAIDALPGLPQVFDAVVVVEARPEGLTKLRTELESLQTTAPVMTVIGEPAAGFIPLRPGDADAIARQLDEAAKAPRSRTLEYRELAQLAAAPAPPIEGAHPAWVLAWIKHADFEGPCAVRIDVEGFNADLARRTAETPGRGLADVARIVLGDPRPHVLYRVPPGTSVAVLLESKVSFPVEIVAAIARSMAHAIDALHQRGCELAAIQPGLVWIGEDGLIRHLGRGIVSSDEGFATEGPSSRADVRRLGLLLAKLLKVQGESTTAASSTDLSRVGALGLFVDACILEPPAIATLASRVESLGAASAERVAEWLEQVTGAGA